MSKNSPIPTSKDDIGKGKGIPSRSPGDVGTTLSPYNINDTDENKNNNDLNNESFESTISDLPSHVLFSGKQEEVKEEEPRKSKARNHPRQKGATPDDGKKQREGDNKSLASSSDDSAEWDQWNAAANLGWRPVVDGNPNLAEEDTVQDDLQETNREDVVHLGDMPHVGGDIKEEVDEETKEEVGEEEDTAASVANGVLNAGCEDVDGDSTGETATVGEEEVGEEEDTVGDVEDVETEEDDYMVNLELNQAHRENDRLSELLREAHVLSDGLQSQLDDALENLRQYREEHDARDYGLSGYERELRDTITSLLHQVDGLKSVIRDLQANNGAPLNDDNSVSSVIGRLLLSFMTGDEDPWQVNPTVTALFRSTNELPTRTNANVRSVALVPILPHPNVHSDEDDPRQNNCKINADFYNSDVLNQALLRFVTDEDVNVNRLSTMVQTSMNGLSFQGKYVEYSLVQCLILDLLSLSFGQMPDDDDPANAMADDFPAMTRSLMTQSKDLFTQSNQMGIGWATRQLALMVEVIDGKIKGLDEDNGDTKLKNLYNGVKIWPLGFDTVTSLGPEDKYKLKRYSLILLAYVWDTFGLTRGGTVNNSIEDGFQKMWCPERVKNAGQGGRKKKKKRKRGEKDDDDDNSEKKKKKKTKKKKKEKTKSGSESDESDGRGD